MLRHISHSFFERDPRTCASELIGCELVWNGCGGVVVETEAYSVEADEACHTFARPSARHFVERHPAGAAYVYLNYGMYWLLNVLVKNGAEDGFVLLRALQPTRGIEAMRKRRGQQEPRTLCSGPGKLAQALSVTGEHHGIDLCVGPGRCFLPRQIEINVTSDVRVGISKAMHLPWRFLLADSPYVSVRQGRVKLGNGGKRRRPTKPAP